MASSRAARASCWTRKGRIVESTSPLAVLRGLRFQDDRLQSLCTAAGVVSNFGYDAAGFPSFSQRSDGAAEYFVYSAAGDIQSYTLSDGTVLRFERDAERRLKRIIDRNGYQTNWCTTKMGALPRSSTHAVMKHVSFTPTARYLSA